MLLQLLMLLRLLRLLLLSLLLAAIPHGRWSICIAAWRVRRPRRRPGVPENLLCLPGAAWMLRQILLVRLLVGLWLGSATSASCAGGRRHISIRRLPHAAAVATSRRGGGLGAVDAAGILHRGAAAARGAARLERVVSGRLCGVAPVAGLAARALMAMLGLAAGRAATAGLEGVAALLRRRHGRLRRPAAVQRCWAAAVERMECCTVVLLASPRVQRRRLGAHVERVAAHGDAARPAAAGGAANSCHVAGSGLLAKRRPLLLPAQRRDGRQWVAARRRRSGRVLPPWLLLPAQGGGA